MALKRRLFETLQELGDEEFRNFKWFLQQPDNLDGFPVIPKSYLEKADRQETVDQMVQKHGSRSVEVLKKNLQNINRNDLVEILFNTNRTVQEMKNSQPVRNYKERLQSNLQDTFRCIHEGWSVKRNLFHLSEVYTELCVTTEVEQPVSRIIPRIEMAFGEPSETKISNIFTRPSGIKTNMRTVMTSGDAGMGKTFLVHKFVLDWTENRTNQDVHLMFPLQFDMVNFPWGHTLSLAELLHTCIPETVHMTEEELNNIFTSMQTSGNSNFEKSEYKIIFVLDGLNLQLDFTATEKLPVDVTKPTSVEMLVTNLIRGYLLPSARLWITARPSGAAQIPPEFINMQTELRGFADQQREEYFRKRFRDEEQANRIISHIKMCPSLRYMCHIPVFCWITAEVLQAALKTSRERELPRTLTEIYIELLLVLYQNMNQKFGKPKSFRYLETLMKLAFSQLKNRGLLFSEERAKEEDISSFKDFSLYPEVFSQFFKEEHYQKMDGKKVFSFLHRSIVEFLAALFVVSHRRNQKNTFQIPRFVYSQILQQESLHQIIDRAVNNSDRDLDTFLHFLLGLTVHTSQHHLQDLLSQTGSNSESGQLMVQRVKKKIRDSPLERKITLFPCLNELMDSSPVNEVQHFLKSEPASMDELSPRHWSALVFILLSSLKDLHVFDLKKYSPAEKVLLGLLPLVKTSKTSLLNGCNLSGRSCTALSSVFSSPFCSLRKLDLSNNELRDSGLELLTTGLRSPHCKLQTLRLICCSLSRRSCETLSSVLGLELCSLEELDLSSNDLQDSGMELLSTGLRSPLCKLETLRVCDCKLSEDISDALGDMLSGGLRQLDLRNNQLGPSVEELCQCFPPITVWTHNISLDEIISKSVLIRSGCPSVYQLGVKKEITGPLTRVVIGEKKLDKVNRKILFVGETGAEKCALVNALFNHSIGVKFDDEVWFQAAEEEGRQRANMMLYEIFGFEDKTLPYSLTIIDAPGHEEIERNTIIRERLTDFLQEDNSGPVIVCLVLKAADSLQSSRLQHTYDSVMSLFGETKDRCTVLLITNADGRNHSNILQDLETTKIKFLKNDRREPFYFLFNNRQHEDRTGNPDELEQAYKSSDRELGKFTGFLKEAEAKMVLAVLEEHQELSRLKACIQNLQDRIKLTDLKVAEIKQVQEALQRHKEDITTFSVEMDEVYKDKDPIKGGKWLWFFYKGALCCTVCKENCHYPGCSVAKTPAHCEMMRDGLCAVCTNKCPVSVHVKEKWRFVTKTKKVQMTLLDVRQKYEKNKSESEDKINLLENLEEEVQHQKAKKSEIIEEIYQHVARLQQIDPNNDSVSSYLDLSVESRDTEEMLRLEELRRQKDEQQTDCTVS